MSVTTRTNLAINPNAATTTNWGGTGGGGTGGFSVTNQSGTGAFGSTFNRLTWTTANTSGNGGITYLQTGLNPSTAYAHQIWVRPSKAITMNLVAAYQTVAGANVNTVTSTSVAVPANTWTQLTVAGTSGSGAFQVLLTAQAAVAGSNWAFNDTLDGDAVCIETGSTVGTYFDGSFVSAANVVYAWTGTANASTSTATTYQPVISVVAKTDAPCPRVDVTIQDLAPTAATVNVWRTADGKRQAVRGARNRSLVGSDAVTDYEAPLGRVLSYDLEVLTGINTQAAVTTATVTVLSSTWWIQDPLIPSSAIPLNVSKQDSTAPYLTGNAIKSLDYGASVTLIPILGSPDPVALMGNRTIAGNVTFDMFTNLASVTTQLRNLIQQTPLLLIRSTGTRNNGIPGLAYFTSAKPSEKPVTVAFGGTLTNWSLTGDLVAAPTMNVLVPIWTYGTVAALWTTYQQAQTTLAGKTYLDVLKSPSGV